MSETTSPPMKVPKTMSSKLLTMKFMQRAAASIPVSTPSTPDQPSPKRQKTDDSSPASLDVESVADKSAVQAAMASEEAKRQIALDRQAADAGDTRWVLTFKPNLKTAHVRNNATIQITETGFGAIDHLAGGRIASQESEELNLDNPLIVGRKSFGKFNRTIEKLQDPSTADSSDSDEDEDENEAKSGDESEDSGDDETNALIKAAQEANIGKVKAERKEKRKSEQAELFRLAEQRKKKDVRLNHLRSISGTGTTPGHRQDPKVLKACHNCGQAGHLKKNCPKEGKQL